MNMVPSSKCKK